MGEQIERLVGTKKWHSNITINSPSNTIYLLQMRIIVNRN